MRTKRINHTEVIYPEKVIWLQDSNVIQLSSDTRTVGAQITVTHPSGENKTVRYLSELHTLVFTLDDILLSLHDDNIGRYTVEVEVYENGSQSGQISFAVQVLNGKTYQDRSHGTSRVIYIYNPDELTKLQIYSPENGTVSVSSSSYDIYEGLNQLNLGWVTDSLYLCMSGESSQPITYITSATGTSPYSGLVELQFETASDEGESGGDIWGSKVTFPICNKLEMVDHCDDYNFCELCYTDADGCIRYLGGKVIEQNDKAESSIYKRVETQVYKNVPRKKINSLERTIKIGFTNIDKNAYPEDILISENVYFRNYQGEWKQCYLKTDSISVNNDDFIDFELEITTIL